MRFNTGTMFACKGINGAYLRMSFGVGTQTSLARKYKLDKVKIHLTNTVAYFAGATMVERKGFARFPPVCEPASWNWLSKGFIKMTIDTFDKDKFQIQIHLPKYIGSNWIWIGNKGLFCRLKFPRILSHKDIIRGLLA